MLPNLGCAYDLIMTQILFILCLIYIMMINTNIVWSWSPIISTMIIQLFYFLVLLVEFNSLDSEPGVGGEDGEPATADDPYFYKWA